jgi:pSer/pThr/pTyr-binding forkhead associated (FHA) protein
MKFTPELIIISENEKGKAFPLTSKAYSLGRSSSCDIHFKDPSVSTTHCELVMTDSGNYIMRDMDSTNGSKVNDKYVKSVELKNGDILRIGKTELLYSLEKFSPVSGSETKTIIDLANIGDSEPIAPMANVSDIPRSNNAIGKDKLFSKITIYISILLVIAIIGLILWLLVI